MAVAVVSYVHAYCQYPGNPTPSINDLNLDIKDGEFMVLVGPSGSGKSTALRMLAGLEPVSDGEIRIDGTDVSQKPPKDRDIAMVFQSYALYPHMSVAENMGFALKLAGVSKEERLAKVREAAKILNLEEYLERKPKALCGARRCSSWTSRFRTSTRSCGSRRGRTSPSSRRSSARPRSTSRTTRSRP
jgi:multiple sugar transport system ATP-binding protein